MTLPESGSLRRCSPRREADRQPGYDAAFDDSTLFCDVFRHDDDIVLSGPPLLNLREHLLSAEFSVDGCAVAPPDVELADIDRTQRSRIRRTGGATLRIAGLADAELVATVGDDHRPLFAQRRAVVTLLRGRQHESLAQWLSFHAAEHGVDAALVYATKTASAERLLEAMSDTGIDVGVVVDWPFPFGPGGGPRHRWDSDFSYSSALEHARTRFLQHAAGVLNISVTQLVLTDDGRSVFDHAAHAPRRLLRFGARWIEGATDVQRGERPRSFRDYCHHRLMPAPAPRWVLVPDPVTAEGQWRVRSVGAIDAPASVRVLGREFRNLANRKAPDRPVEPGLDHLDRALRDAVERVLPDPDPSPDRPPARGLARLTARLQLRDPSARDAATPRGRSDTAGGGDYDYLFIMTYGRSGSTLMQGILSSIPGYLIRGESRQMLYSLFTFHHTSVVERRRLSRASRLPPTHPWFGIDGYPDDTAFEGIRKLALDTLFRPESDTRTVGMKEIEWTQPDLLDYVGFLRSVFPGARFVVNTRDLDQVAASKWWAKRPNALQEIGEREAHILTVAEALGDAAFRVHYNDYVAEPGTLRGLFDWLGEPFDEESVRAIMSQRHSY